MHNLRKCGNFLAALAVVLTATAVQAQPQFAEPAFDAGKVYTCKPLAHKFTFVNTGNSPITFTDAKPSCACMKPKLPEGPVLPGQQGSVEMDVHTQGQPAGPTAWGVRLKYRAGDREGEVNLVLKAELVAEVTVEPAVLQMFVSKGQTATIRVDDWRHQTFHIKTVQSSSPHLKASKRNDILPTGGLTGATTWISWPISIEVTEDFPVGRHEEVVTIYTDDAEYAEIKVPVTIVKSPKQCVAAFPAEVQLLGTVGQPISSRIILLRDSDDQPVVIEKASADNPAITCNWASLPGPAATLKVQVDHNKLTDQGLRGAVQVEIMQPVRQTVTIPVHVLLKNASR